MQYLDECSSRGVALARDGEGRLYRRAGDAWEYYDFNGDYAGYYLPCRFTAVAVCGELFYIAGLDANGRPHLFSSLSGSVWDEHSLSAQSPLGDRMSAAGSVVKILWDEGARQVLLLTDAGQVVTLPDCPKCLRVRALKGRPLDARLHDGALEIDVADGTRQTLPLSALRQYRVSWSYAAGLLRQGARVVDLRGTEEYAHGHLPGSENVPFSGLEDWLSQQPKAAICLFLCRTGVLADEAADYARAGGWASAYSLGGLEAFAHVD